MNNLSKMAIFWVNTQKAKLPYAHLRLLEEYSMADVDLIMYHNFGYETDNLTKADEVIYYTKINESIKIFKSTVEALNNHFKTPETKIKMDQFSGLVMNKYNFLSLKSPNKLYQIVSFMYEQLMKYFLQEICDYVIYWDCSKRKSRPDEFYFLFNFTNTALYDFLYPH